MSGTKTLRLLGQIIIGIVWLGNAIFTTATVKNKIITEHMLEAAAKRAAGQGETPASWRQISYILRLINERDPADIADILDVLAHPTLLLNIDNASEIIDDLIASETYDDDDDYLDDDDFEDVVLKDDNK
jgi:hypothetical protein